MGWLDALRPKRATLCDICMQRARDQRQRTVYVYENGHILAPGTIPPISAWPMPTGVSTHCGRDIYGMGTSRLYRLDGAAGEDAG